MSAARVQATGERLAELAADLDAAVAELWAPFADGGGLWERGVPGKWTAGQHADHVAVVIGRTAEDFERAAAELRAGRLAARPGRGWVQRLWVGLLVGGRMPRGGRTRPLAYPGREPLEQDVRARTRDGVKRHRSLAEALDAADRDRLWIPNPFLPRWHYTLPEMVRVHAVHARHHAALVREIAARRG